MRTGMCETPCSGLVLAVTEGAMLSARQTTAHCAAVATSIFDPIAVGRIGEDFVDGATGVNSPVKEA
jgi:hypothetical protein